MTSRGLQDARPANRDNGDAISVSAQWKCAPVVPPSALFGAYGIQVGPGGQLYVAEGWGSQISALDPDSGVAEVICPQGGPIVCPDDVAFDSQGTMYVTEVMSARVSARTANGEHRVIADNVTGANGITVHQDRIFMDESVPGGRMWELYPDGRAPRLLAENLPRPNALQVGPDGYLYFPVIEANAIWRIAPEGGTPQPFATDLGFPTAVKINSKGELFSTQAYTGEVIKIDIRSGARQVYAKLRPGLDNLALTSDNRIFVTHFVDNSITELLPDGGERQVLGPGFIGPYDLAVAGEGTLYACDGISIAEVGHDGTHRRVGMMSDGEFPGFVRGLAAAANGKLVVTTSSGDVTTYDPVSHEMIQHATGLQELYSVATGPGGVILVAEGGSGRLLVIDGQEVKVAAKGLARPTGVAVASDGSCYVAESGKGRVVHLNGGVSEVVGGLQEPQGLLVDGDDLYIVDAGARELVHFSATTRQRATVATNLPVGPPVGVVPKPIGGIPGLFPGPFPTFAGIAQTPDGTIFVAADAEGSILAFRRG